MNSHSKDLIHSDIYDHAQEGSFLSAVVASFTYPLRNKGWAVLLGGIILFVIVNMLSTIPFVGIVIGFFGGGYFTSYLMRILSSSSDGGERLPDWPEFANFYEDIVAPAFRWGTIIMLSIVPAVTLLFMGMPKAAIAAGIAGLVYMPMALMASALHESILAANPLVVLPAILKAPLQYSVTIAFLAVVALSSAALQGALAQLGFFAVVLVVAVSLYFAIVQARVLGLLYYFNDEAFNWFGEADRFYR